MTKKSLASGRSQANVDRESSQAFRWLKMHVLHIAATLGRGGIATSLWHLLPALNKLPGQEVAGAVCYEKGYFGDLMEKNDIVIYHFQMAHKYDPRVVWKLVKLHREYDVIHAHGWPIILFVALASLVSAKPHFVLTEHSVTNRRRRPLLKWLDRFIYSRFEQIVAVSEAVAASLQEWQPQVGHKITVIHNGICMAYFQTAESKNEIRQRLELNEQTPVIFASGNFHFAKGIDLLLQSMLILLETYRSELQSDEQVPVLIITGEGPLEHEMAELAWQLGIGEHVRFLGFRTDMPLILKAADLFVLSSRWEGCPMVVLESMALGVPILATKVGGVPELVLDNQTGKLIPSGSPSALASGIYELMQDSERAGSFAERGQQRLALLFNSEDNARKMTTLYRRAAGYINE